MDGHTEGRGKNETYEIPATESRVASGTQGRLTSNIQRKRPAVRQPSTRPISFRAIDTRRFNIARTQSLQEGAALLLRRVLRYRRDGWHGTVRLFHGGR